MLEGVVGLAYYRHTDPTRVNNIVRAIDAVSVRALTAEPFAVERNGAP